MKAVIPAAGMGKRLRPQTNTKPKPMVNVAGKPIIGHILDSLKGLVKDVVIIVGYQKERLIESVQRNYSKDFNLIFVEQTERMGLGHAIFTAKEAVEGEDILIHLGDEIFGMDYSEMFRIYKEDCGKCDGILGVKTVDRPQHYGIVEEINGAVKRLVEKPAHPTSNTAIAGVYFIRNTPLLFEILGGMVKEEKTGKGGEYQLTDALQEMIERGGIFRTFDIEEWYDCGRPEMLLNVNRILLDRAETEVDSDTENSVLIPPVIIGKDCKIRNSIIGPYVSVDEGTVMENIHISDSIVGSHCRLKGLFLKKSIIDDEVTASGRPYSINAGQNSSISLG